MGSDPLEMLRILVCSAAVLGTVLLNTVLPNSSAQLYGQDKAGEVVVFAAASTRNAIEEIASITERQIGLKLIPSYGSSSSLARLIVEGAEPGLFVSANRDWVDRLEREGHLVAGTRIELLTNKLMLATRTDSGVSITMTPEFDIGAAFEGRFAMADPQHVPLGVYGKAALESLGWWQALEGRLVPTRDASAAATLVVRGECALGVLYRTELLLHEELVAVGVFPTTSYPPIRYPVALVTEGPEARKLLQFMISSEAAEIFAHHGFLSATAADLNAVADTPTVTAKESIGALLLSP